jgi:NADH dehydrogenase FAD-containing subunit
MTSTVLHQIVIVGGGTADITVAAQLTRGWFHRPDVTVIDAAEARFFHRACLFIKSRRL